MTGLYVLVAAAAVVCALAVWWETRPPRRPRHVLWLCHECGTKHPSLGHLIAHDRTHHATCTCAGRPHHPSCPERSRL